MILISSCLCASILFFSCSWCNFPIHKYIYLFVQSHQISNILSCNKEIMYGSYDNLDSKSADLSRWTLYKIWHPKCIVSADPQVLSQTLQRVDWPSLNMKSSLFCLLAVGNNSSFHYDQGLSSYLQALPAVICCSALAMSMCTPTLVRFSPVSPK